jgi:hypothetical protein
VRHDFQIYCRIRISALQGNRLSMGLDKKS